MRRSASPPLLQSLVPSWCVAEERLSLRPPPPLNSPHTCIVCEHQDAAQLVTGTLRLGQGAHQHRLGSLEQTHLGKVWKSVRKGEGRGRVPNNTDLAALSRSTWGEGEKVWEREGV